MKKLNKVLVVALVLFAFAATSLTVYAFTFNKPAEKVSTYGSIAYDEGRWEEFREEVLKSKKSYLDEMVNEGVITQEEADVYYNNMLEMQEFHNKTGGFGMGCGFGGRGMMGFGGRGMMGFGGRGMSRNWQ